ncbi:hypothetical protein LF95_06430 [Thalassospira sp. TSL5-1]|nr:hypothetical protein LF95_06430 [Thalassospira sp. TSL5-1]
MWRGLYKGWPGLASVFLQKNNNDLAAPVFRGKSVPGVSFVVGHHCQYRLKITANRKPDDKFAVPGIRK